MICTIATQRTIRAIFVWLVLVSFAPLSVAGNRTDAIDPAAVQVLQRMTDYLRSLDRFSVQTQNTLEDLLATGQRIDLDVTARIKVDRPNRVRAERVGADASQDFFYDGSALTLFVPAKKIYVTVDAPETIGQMLDFTRESLGLIIPSSDLVYMNAFDILMQKVVSARLVGPTVINGITCDHLVIHRTDVDLQVWVASGDEPLPCKYVVTDTSTPELISTVTVMSNWDTGPAFSDAVFEFTPPKGAQATKFIPLD